MKTLLIILALVAPSFGQLSADEAQQRLEARRIAATQPSNIIATLTEENRRLSLEIASLRSELKAMKGKPQTEPADNADLVAVEQAAPKVVTASRNKFIIEVKVGVTRQQIYTYVAQHKTSWRITKDVRGADKQELLTLERYETQNVATGGKSTNGVSVYKDYEQKKVPLNTYELILLNEVVTEMTAVPNAVDLSSGNVGSRGR